MRLQLCFQMCAGLKLTDVCPRNSSVWKKAIMRRHEEGQSKREREDRQGRLVPMYESQNAVDGGEAARDDRRMTVWLWNDT